MSLQACWGQKIFKAFQNLPPDAISDRYSMPMFVHPRDEIDLTPRPEFIEMTGGKALYEPITAAEYLHQRLVEIGLIS